MPELKQLDAQMVLTGIRVLSDQFVVFKRHQNSMRGASVETRHDANFTHAQFLVLESETIEDLRGPIDHVDPVTIFNSFRTALRRGCQALGR
jgi:capsule polysaccharide export protein KpsC/LpsZ